MLLSSSALWLNDTILDVAAGAAELSAFALACIATCTPQQALLPTILHADTLQLAAEALDAARRIGIADLAINFPWVGAAA